MADRGDLVAGGAGGVSRRTDPPAVSGRSSRLQPTRDAAAPRTGQPGSHHGVTSNKQPLPAAPAITDQRRTRLGVRCKCG